MRKYEDVEEWMSTANPWGESDIQRWISGRVLFLLQEQRMTRTELAGSAHLDLQRLGFLLHNRKMWSIGEVYAVCRVFAVELGDVLPPLLGRVGDS